ncbi:MAG: hypothetical protein U0Q12_08770 [Vicinamibacterales bacterium]
MRTSGSDNDGVFVMIPLAMLIGLAFILFDDPRALLDACGRFAREAWQDVARLVFR